MMLSQQMLLQLQRSPESAKPTALCSVHVYGNNKTISSTISSQNNNQLDRIKQSVNIVLFSNNSTEGDLSHFYFPVVWPCIFDLFN